MKLYEPETFKCTKCKSGRLAVNEKGFIIPEKFKPCNCGALIDQLSKEEKKKIAPKSEWEQMLDSLLD